MTQGQGPVLRVADDRIAPDNRPPWCAAAGIGVFRIRSDATFDPYLHDSAAYWLIYEGKAKVSVDGRTHYAQAGDVVCTPAGAVHDIVEIYEEVEAFYLEEPLPDGGRLVTHPDDLARDPDRSLLRACEGMRCVRRRPGLTRSTVSTQSGRHLSPEPAR
jgi:hypothetical protein